MQMLETHRTLAMLLLLVTMVLMLLISEQNQDGGFGTIPHYANDRASSCYCPSVLTLSLCSPIWHTAKLARQFQLACLRQHVCIRQQTVQDMLLQGLNSIHKHHLSTEYCVVRDGR